jgi:predicted GTPase
MFPNKFSSMFRLATNLSTSSLHRLKMGRNLTKVKSTVIKIIDRNTNRTAHLHVIQHKIRDGSSEKVNRKTFLKKNVARRASTLQNSTLVVDAWPYPKILD